MNLFVCLTAPEWRNLCSTGRVRLHASRAVLEPDPAVEAYGFALFSSAPDRFALGESSEFIIAECSKLRRSVAAVVAPSDYRGTRWLVLEDVLSFFPVRADDAWVFEADAEKIAIRLDTPRFEGVWSRWVMSQRVDQACIDGMTLARTLGLLDEESSAERSPIDWSRVAAEAVVPPRELQPGGDLVLSLLSSRDRLFDLVREDIDTAAIFVSCSVEWVRLITGEDLMGSDPDFADWAGALHRELRNMPFDLEAMQAEALVTFFERVAGKAHAAFSQACSPSLVTLYVCYAQRLRFGKPAPDDVIAAVKAEQRLMGPLSASLLAYLLGIVMGASRVHGLQRQLVPEKFQKVTMVGSSAIASSLL